tara:strand:- start:800 stop:1930 length:1131 start_codon:yes stop_codon:yes gene_type:complete
MQSWRGSHTGVVKVVTGGGKTIFALFCIEEYLTKYPNTRVIITVPTVALMDQWFVEIIGLTSLSEDEISLHGGGHRSQDYGKICLMVMNTARTLSLEARRGQRTLLIVDECHRSASKENRKAIDIAANATLGLSATPEREYDDLFEEIISPILGDVIFTYDYQRAHEDGVISDFVLFNVKIGLSPEEEEEYASLTKAIASSSGLLESKIPPSVLRRSSVVACAARRVPGTVSIVQMHRNEKIIIFHERIDEMLKIHKSLRESGINALAYHSKQGPHIRRNNLLMFRKGVSNVLVTCKALDEGLNVPEASIGIISASTSSTRQRVQRLGRILRPSPEKEFSSIYTIYATEKEEVRLAEECVRMQGVSQVNWMQGVVE